MNYKSIVYSRFVFISILLHVVSCGGEGGRGDTEHESTTSSTGSVGLLLTDGFTDQFDAVNVTVIKVQLLSDNDAVTIFDGEKTVNLLDYRNNAEMFSLNSTVPVGTYNKIRLTLGAIALVKCDRSKGDAYNVDTTYNVDTYNVDTCTNTISEQDQLRLTGNKKMDLNPRGEFEVEPDTVLMLEIDIDAEKSIHITRGGDGRYHFRPVVFVNVVSDEAPVKLVRTRGEITDLNLDELEFDICSDRVQLLGAEHRAVCVTVKIDSNTSIFDTTGASVTAETLVEGEVAVVIGRLKREPSWDEPEREDDDDDSDSDNNSDDNDQNNGLHDVKGLFISALVIELGAEVERRTLTGIAKSTVDENNRFTMTINPGQGVSEGSQVLVQIQRDTQIVNKTGDVFNVDVINNNVVVSVDGELQLSEFEPAVLMAQLIVITIATDLPDRLSGMISLFADESCGLILTTEDGDRGVSLDQYTDILSIDDNNGTQTSETISEDDLRGADNVDVYGELGSDGCFHASIILVFSSGVT